MTQVQWELLCEPQVALGRCVGTLQSPSPFTNTIIFPVSQARVITKTGRGYEFQQLCLASQTDSKDITLPMEYCLWTKSHQCFPQAWEGKGWWVKELWEGVYMAEVVLICYRVSLGNLFVVGLSDIVDIYGKHCPLSNSNPSHTYHSMWACSTWQDYRKKKTDTGSRIPGNLLTCPETMFSLSWKDTPCQ